MNGRPAVNLESPQTQAPLSSSPPSARSTGSEPTPQVSVDNNTVLSRRNTTQNLEELAEREEEPTATSTMLSPRSSNYERLEGGMGPSKMGNRKKFAWKKFAIGAAVIIGLVWFFGPRENIQKISKPWSTTEEGNQNKLDHPTEPDHRPPVHGNNDDDTEIHRPPPESSGHPTSFKEDSDPMSTTYCTKPYSSTAPLVQWALMIDAGSTGSRIHIYKFNNCQKNPSFEYEVFKMIKGGLSDYEGRPQEAAESLDSLMEEAIRVVPGSLQSCTPVAVKATAGLRLLSDKDSSDILKAVEKRLREHYSFKLHEPEGVVIMDGKDEGVYAWITANYLLDTIRDSTKGVDTYATLDLGGASTQIVFEPKFSKPDSSLEEGDHKYELEFAGKKYVLYQHSYLGYGLMKARSRVHHMVEFMASLDPSREKVKKDDLEVFWNPCIVKGMSRTVEIEDLQTHDKRNVTMVGDDIGSFDACNKVIEFALAKDAICKLKPCSFNGVYQPSLLDTFANRNVILLSYFYDRLEPILSGAYALDDGPDSLSEDIIHTPSTSSPNGNPKLSISSIASLARTICEGKSSWEERLKPSDTLKTELEGRPESCLDLTFMHALLRLGYEFSGEMEVELGKRIDGTELGWCLGASLAMVGGGNLKCKI